MEIEVRSMDVSDLKRLGELEEENNENLHPSLVRPLAKPITQCTGFAGPFIRLKHGSVFLDQLRQVWVRGG